MVQIIFKSLCLFLALIFISSCSSFSKNQNPSIIQSDYSKNEINQKCDLAISDLRESIDALIQSQIDKKAPSNFLHTYQFLDLLIFNMSDIVEPLTFMGSVHSDKFVRDEAVNCEKKVSQIFTEIYTNEKLYSVLKDIKSKDKVEIQLILKINESFLRNGVNLPESKRKELVKLKNQISDLESDYSKILNESKLIVLASKENMSGLPESFVKSLKVNRDDLYEIPVHRANYNTLLENAESSDLRKDMFLKFTQRGGEENIQKLEQALVLRQKLASILGYQDWVQYKLKDRMAQNTNAVLRFYKNLKKEVISKNKQDLALLEKLKQEKFPTELLKPWDILYYANLYRKINLNIDQEVVKSYFPSKHVISKMLDIFSELFSIQFQEVKNVDSWNKDVKIYKILDNGSLIAYFYMDLYPREGKYGHAAAFTLIKGRQLPKNKYSIPVSAIVANFTPPTGDLPALLTHPEVETLLHEFGHILHQVLTRAPYGHLSGTRVARDFVEAPSQMLEGWAWNKEILKQLSSHYMTQESLPDALIEKMIAAKNFNKGYHYARQMYIGLFDLNVHLARGKVDTLSIYKNLHKEFSGLEVAKGDLFPSSFGHIMGAYDAGYYGYLWSEVYAQDMFSEFKSKGLLDKNTGLSFRKNILEPGSMQEPLVLIKNFLNRKPNTKAFKKELGLKN